MSDIFVSYSSKDRELARILVNSLTGGWDVWWDDSAAGRFWKIIEQEVSLAKCMVSIWSTNARDSSNVFGELELARIILVLFG
jgi:hypothetical protein